MKKKNNIKYDFILKLLFFLYLAVLCYLLFFSEDMGRREGLTEYRYNFRPFREIMRYIKNYETVGAWRFLINIVGNVIAFIPFGFLFPFFINRTKGKMLFTVFIGVVFTCAIEFTQLLTKVGIFDVDDIILNAIGVITGYIIFHIGEISVRKVKTSK